MIPAKTLRDRLREAALKSHNHTFVNEETVDHLVNTMIDAIGDPCLIKTADSLEPTATFRAQDLGAPVALHAWASYVSGRSPPEKAIWGIDHAKAFEQWPTRKWPD